MKINNVTPNMSQNINKNNKNVAFSGKLGNVMSETGKELSKLERVGTMTRPLFVLNAFLFLLGGRLISSRDKNEKRETLTRDVPTIIIAVFGVPVIEKFVAKQIQKSKGFAIGEEIDKLQVKVASGEQLKDWYKYNEHLATGFEGFSQRLSEKGGNLKKICSKLSEDIKGKLTGFSENNAEFIKTLSETKNNGLKETIKKAFSSPESNKALEHAAFLKSVPKLIGFVLTLSTIGIFIPKLNIHVTETINKKSTKRKIAEEQAKAQAEAKQTSKV